ncbi:hypothetical protein IFM47457_06351 [Aspergillus lentulus]|nr:hypothetical protein IFM47457_06351 [Aspergillus lentulus]
MQSWQKIDPPFFGPTESPEKAWKDRLGLLDEKEEYEMEQLVARKLEETKTRVLAWDPDEYSVYCGFSSADEETERKRQNKREPMRMNRMKPTRWRTAE